MFGIGQPVQRQRAPMEWGRGVRAHVRLQVSRIHSRGMNQDSLARRGVMWVRTPPPPAGVTNPFARSGYGFQIWQLDDTGAYTALGLQGQFIYVHPATRTVIVKLSFFPEEGSPKSDAALEDTLAYFKTLTTWKP